MVVFTGFPDIADALFPMGLTISTAGGVSFSRAPTEVHCTLSEVLATLDCSDAQAVKAARARIEPLASTLFPKQAFDGMDSDGFFRAVTTLILYQRAGEQKQTTEGIEDSRDDALRTLAARLTPPVRDALLRRREADLPEDETTRYFAAADSACLAGYLYLQRADALGFAGATGKTPEDADALAAARAQRAAEDYQKAACAFTQAGALGLAAGAWQQAGTAWLQTDQSDQALAAYQQAAESARGAADACPAEEPYRQAADTYQLLAQTCYDRGQLGPAADAWQQAANLYTRAHQPEKAAGAWEQAGDAHKEGASWGDDADPHQTAARYGQAGNAYRSRAAILTDLGEHRLAIDASVMAASAYGSAAEVASSAREPLLAAHHYLMAALAHTAAGERARAAAADHFASLQEQLALHAYGKAADAFIKAREFAAAADAYRLAQRFTLAAAAYEQTVHGYLVANEPLGVADAWYSVGVVRSEGKLPPHEVAEAFLIAAEIYEQEGEDEQAAEAYGHAKEHAHAAGLYLKVARARLEKKELAQAAEAFSRVGEQRRAAGRPHDEVVEAFLTAARLFRQVHAMEAAAHAYAQASDFLHAAPLFAQANRFYLAGFAYRQMRMFKLAAKFYLRASEQAADPVEQTQLRDDAKALFRDAGTQFARSNQNL
jgi:tetratricopeptide (TPR) repeat protein